MNQRQQPRWRQDFPVEWSEDHYVARREFARFLVLGSLGLLVGNVWVWGKSLVGRSPAPAQLAIAGVNELPVGGVKLFRFPTAADPAILIRLDDQCFVAYSQKCTHLSCAVYYDHDEGSIRCPCHHGFFAPADGHPTAGPPTRPLPHIDLLVAQGRIYAVGVKQA